MEQGHKQGKEDTRVGGTYRESMGQNWKRTFRAFVFDTYVQQCSLTLRKTIQQSSWEEREKNCAFSRHSFYDSMILAPLGSAEDNC